jgi:hypothetical protein
MAWGEAADIAHREVQQRTRFAFEQLEPTFVTLGPHRARAPNRPAGRVGRLEGDRCPAPGHASLPGIRDAWPPRD